MLRVGFECEPVRAGDVDQVVAFVEAGFAQDAPDRAQALLEVEDERRADPGALVAEQVVAGQHGGDELHRECRFPVPGVADDDRAAAANDEWPDEEITVRRIAERGDFAAGANLEPKRARLAGWLSARLSEPRYASQIGAKLRSDTSGSSLTTHSMSVG